MDQLKSMSQLKRSIGIKKVPHKASIQENVRVYPVKKVKMERTKEEWDELTKKGKR